MDRSRRYRASLAIAALAALAAVPACDGADRQPDGSERTREQHREADDAGEVQADSPKAVSPAGGEADRQETRFEVRQGMLYRQRADEERPLLALDSAAAPSGVPVVPGYWETGPRSGFRVDAEDLRQVVPSPEGRWVAWETESVHALVGVVPADGGPLTVLDFYFDSSARDLTWAPGGRFLAAFYLPPSGLEELRVYDAEAGTRLRTPWGEACRPRDGCRVAGVEWTGGTTLVVTTADGSERRYEVDISELSSESSDVR